MSKILAESLSEYRGSKESINEATGLFGDLATQGKQFRKMFLPACYALIKKDQKDKVISMTKWLKKLAELGYPNDKELKASLGNKNFQGLKQVNQFLNNSLPSFAATPGGSHRSKSGDTGKSDEQRLSAIVEVVGMKATDIAALLKKG